MRRACLSLPVLLVAALMPADPATAAAAAASVEQRIVASVDAQQEAALALLQRVVDINSGTMNLDGVREVGGIFRGELDGLGFQTRWVDGAPWSVRATSWPSVPRAPRKRCCSSATSTPCSRRTVRSSASSGWRATRRAGPGVIDMKGGDVIMMVALRALLAAGVLDQMSVRW